MTRKKLRMMKLFMLFSFIVLVLTVSSELIYFYKNKNERTMPEPNTQETQISKNTEQLNNTEELNSSTEQSNKNIKNSNNSTALPDGEASTVINNTQTTMVFAGDIYMSDYITQTYDTKGLKGVLSDDLIKEIKQADISMVNQEFSFSTRGTPMEDKQFTFRIDPKYVKLFQEMELDVVTLANNHVLDFGTEALEDTFTTLTNADIKYVGAGKDITEAKETKYFEVNNKTIAVLGASRVIPVTTWNAGSHSMGLLTTYDPTLLVEEIGKAKQSSDYIVVYVHWGIERNTMPEDYQRDLAKRYIDAGADLVVGSHPHVLQGVEYYNGKPIIYSLGNFMFYGSIKQTALLKVVVDANNNTRLELLPCKALNGQTFLQKNESERKQFYKEIEAISYGITIDENGLISY